MEQEGTLICLPCLFQRISGGHSEASMCLILASHMIFGQVEALMSEFLSISRHISCVEECIELGFSEVPLLAPLSTCLMNAKTLCMVYISSVVLLTWRFLISSQSVQAEDAVEAFLLVSLSVCSLNAETPSIV